MPQSPADPRLPLRGFSFAEMLVVIAIIVALLGVGIVSLNALTAKKNTRLAAQAVAGAMRAARDHAIANRTRCMVEIVAINDNTFARPTAPGTPCLAADEGPRDKVRILGLRSLQTGSGTVRHVLLPGALKEFALPANCVFDDERGNKRYYPDNATLDTDYNEDGVPDDRPVTKIFFLFMPNGSCTSQAPLVPGQEDRNNVVRVKDLTSGETGTVVVMPHTGLAIAR